jgi:hypothetical protein
MFPYDTALEAALQTTPNSIADVLGMMKAIDSICATNDGLRWFNWLYMQVTQAVEQGVAAGEFSDPAWLAALDVAFASYYFDALRNYLSGAACPGCWAAFFAVRDQAPIARIQFALAGMNAHINHDLPQAIVQTCRSTKITPKHGTPQYADYTALDAPMDALVETAKQTLAVRLPGDALPEVTHLEDTIAAWNLAAARESAWLAAEALWQEDPIVVDVHLGILDGLTTVISKTLLVPVP